jgi:CubicO group peptidase (beta-lactamase class C family)
MSGAVEIQGDCDRRFEKVRDAFAANFATGREVGASFAATIEGEPVVDLWAGFADGARTRPWQRDTIVNVFSTTKAMTALVAHVLADRGLLDLDAPVAKYWPEFAANGKAAMPVHFLLSHRAGLAALRAPLPTEALWDWRRMTDALAAEAPWWEPGTTNGYHAMTYGYLVGEVVRRVAGKTLGAFFRDEIAGPLGADFHIGLAAREHARAGEMVGPTAAENAAAGGAAEIDPASMLGKVMSNPPITPDVANRAEWRSAEIPAANGHGNARSVARVMAVLACGGTLGGRRYLGADAIARATTEQSFAQPDLVLGVPLRWGMGLMLSSDLLPLSPDRSAFGHGGWGGSLGVAVPTARLSWSYVMNKMSPGTLGDTRALGLVGALYGSL